MIFMHKETGEIIFVSWCNGITAHVMSDETGDFFLVVYWHPIKQFYEFIGMI